MASGDWSSFTDSDLTLAATLGSPGAFDELVGRYRPAVLAVARQVAGPSLAEDVAQDAFLLAFQALPQLDEPERFGSWLHAITRNRASRVARSGSLRETVGLPEAAAEIPSEAAGPLAELERAEGVLQVRRALDQLPPELRLALRLRYWDGMPVARIAAFLALPLTTVKWRLHAGRRRMRTLLEAARKAEECESGAVAQAPPAGGDDEQRSGAKSRRGRAGRQDGDAAPGPRAAGNCADRPGCQPHRPAVRRARRGGAAVQHGAGASFPA